MTIAHTDLVVRPMESPDAPAVLELLRSALGPGPAGERSEAFFTWKHYDNPFGTSPGLLAEHEGRPVAVRMFLRWGLVVDGTPVRALRAVDTATAPEFRGRGLFRDLTLELLHRLDAARQVDLVFNTPNASSRPGYLKMGWEAVGTLPVRVSPVRLLRFGTRLGSVGSAVTRAVEDVAATCPFEPTASYLGRHASQLDSLLRRVAPRTGLSTPLSRAFLVWRYGAAPGLDYRCVGVEEAGELRGLAFGRPRQRGDLREFTLSDVLVPAGDRASARRLLALARHSGADHVAIHAAPGSETAAVATRSGYLPVPGKGLGLVVNPRADLPVDPRDPASWHLSLGDLEVF